MADSERSPVSNADSQEKAPPEEADISLVNTKEFAHPALKSREAAELLVAESKYYLSGKRLWLVHTGILLYASITFLLHSLTTL
jgi:hypothetical protein